MNLKRHSIWPGLIPTSKGRRNSLKPTPIYNCQVFSKEGIFYLFFVNKLKVINDQYASHSSGKTVTIKA
jgi:hypothetical protein